MSTPFKEKGQLKRVAISPLRYPGGKGSLFSTLRDIIHINGLGRCTYIEPYAGGAGAGLALLVTGQVRRVIINDLDPSIYAFWTSLIADPTEFAKRVASVDLTVDEWVRQKEIYLSDTTESFDRGFATFYLNRTNRSGVLNGGPIGGMDQRGNYKIDARFNRKTLVERIDEIGKYARQISVTNLDGVGLIRRYARRDNVFIYADPPYFEKAGSLYLNSFTEKDHAELSRCLNAYADCKWVLTYDNVPQVRALYPERRTALFSLNYSAHRVVKAKEIMVFSDSVVVPSES